ncbi:MAG: 4-hydroxy-tetrahydrodipicolinate synthase [Dehalococcoidia bacterium]|nr:4-hydroxy-tetrahydrodipicolinate synthase [Dehalococcoidia bacterium]|tara:strand:- start:746 stop:1639 length:894 start_codon:yes stop_codon:yes gene_type:complete
MSKIGRLLTAMVTPYTAEGEVNYPLARRLAASLVRAGNEGVVVTGTTGEAPLLSDDEKARLWEEIKQELGDEGTVIAGAGTNDTRHSVALAKRAEAVGVDAILAVTPYYLRPPQEGIIEHFRCIAESIDTPVIVYNVPSRTGVNLTGDTLLRLSEIPNIVGNKEANGDLHAAAQLLEARPDFRIWSGNDNDNFHLWCMGAYGAISVTAHIVAGRQRAMLEHVLAGDLAAAAAIHRPLVPLTNACFLNGSPSTIRYVLRELGVEIGSPRLPVVEPTDAVGAQVMAEVRRHHLDSFSLA